MNKWASGYIHNRRRFIKYSSLFLATSALHACANNTSQAPSSSEISNGGTKKFDKITFGTNWLAQAEHGGFYQAIATGIYKDYGLDVTIKMGGPQVASGTQLLLGGAVDFFMGQGVDAINAIAEGIPKITVASIFQKDPQCLIAHPNTGVKT